MSTVSDHLGKLIGNTGSPTKLRVALRGSFSARRGEFVRVPHTEREGQPATDCLGRIVSISRSNVLYSDALGEGIAEVNVLPGSLISGETLYATVELIGFKDPATNEIRLPRRPLDPGAKVYGVDYAFLRDFYQLEPIRPSTASRCRRFSRVRPRQVARKSPSVTAATGG